MWACGGFWVVFSVSRASLPSRDCGTLLNPLYFRRVAVYRKYLALNKARDDCLEGEGRQEKILREKVILGPLWDLSCSTFSAPLQQSPVLDGIGEACSCLIHNIILMQIRAMNDTK